MVPFNTAYSLKRMSGLDHVMRLVSHSVRSVGFCECEQHWWWCLQKPLWILGIDGA